MSSYNTTQHLNKNIEEKITTFCDLFQLQVQRNPNDKAVIFEDKSLTYSELDDQSTKIANHLRSNGISSGKIVALGLYNGLDLLVGIMGIFKSGGVYLPIDPNYPKERIEMMLSDAKPHIFLTNSSLKNQFSTYSNKTILIDQLHDHEPDVRLEPIKPDQPAYVIYTSGSTGKPKGIVVEHKGLSHAALAYQELHPEKLVSLISVSISFDPSLLVIAHALASGGTVCLPQNKSGIDPEHPEEIISLIEKHTINFTLCSPSLYSMILNKSPNLSSLISIDLCGENIPNDLPKIHAKMAPDAILYNAYGPTEYAMGATAAKIYDPLTKQINEITIGKAFSNNEIYILDGNLQKVPEGTKGEIFIGGPGLARGYLNQDVLSAEKFPWVSFPDKEPVRLYRTGDLGRFLPDGNLEFLGRADLQVKIRAHRIELGEIEHTIYQYPGINEAIVVVQEDIPGQKRLVAYFSTTLNEELSEKLKIHLQKKLPSYMVPSIHIQMEHWPYTQNGKIDRAALTKGQKASLSVDS